MLYIIILKFPNPLLMNIPQLSQVNVANPISNMQINTGGNNIPRNMGQMGLITPPIMPVFQG